MKCIARAANFAGLLAWRVNLARNLWAYARPSHDDAWFPDPNGASQALHRSDLRSLDSAVQSRVGDGFLVVFPLDFRGCNKRNLIRVARLPEHEVRGDSEGRGAR